jgi:4-amino-4-deoxy-L-arabinose transferase-like glycosyltransferase
MQEFLKNRWFLFLVLILFVALKLPHLYYPFYWDESWPYASAVKHMYEHGPSLMPGSIDNDLSRGHPLLFHFLISCWMKVFGSSNFVMHSFSLFIAVLFLIAIYEIGLRLFDYKVAMTAVLLVAFQQIYFVQSSFVLLEVMLAFLGFVSIYFYITKKYLLTAISLSMLYYTKESGMVLGLVLGVDALMQLFNKEGERKAKVLNIFSLFIPAVLIAVFFLIQKKVNGWYVFPYHTNALEKNWSAFYDKYKVGVRFLFIDDYKYLIFIVPAMIALIKGFIKKNYRLYVIPLLGLVACLIAFDTSSSQLWQILLLVLMVVLSYLACSATIVKANNDSLRFLRLSMASVAFFTIYTALFFAIERYMLFALVPMLFVWCVLTLNLAGTINNWPFVSILLLIAGTQLLSFRYCRDLYDTKMGAFDGMYVQQEAMNYIENHQYQNKHIAVYENLQWLRLQDFYTGFRKDSRPYHHVRWGMNDSTEVVMIENIESARAIDSSIKLKLDTNFILAHRATRGMAWSEVFVRKK